MDVFTDNANPDTTCGVDRDLAHQATLVWEGLNLGGLRATDKDAFRCASGRSCLCQPTVEHPSIPHYVTGLSKISIEFTQPIGWFSYNN